MALKYCDIDTSWKIKATDNISTVLFCQFETENQVEQTGTFRRDGVVFERDKDGIDDSSPFSMSLVCREFNVKVAAVDILCNAKHMEVFGESAGYLETCAGMWLEQNPKHKNMYLLQHTFNTPLSNFKLKLLSLQEKDQLWLHSLHITLSEMDSDPTPVGALLKPTIDMDKTLNMLQEMGQDVPDKAKSLMNLMRCFQTNAGGFPVGGISGQTAMSAMMGRFATITKPAQGTAFTPGPIAKTDTKKAVTQSHERFTSGETAINVTQSQVDHAACVSSAQSLSQDRNRNLISTEALSEDQGANLPALQSLLQDSGATVPALQSLLQDSGATVPALQSLLQDSGPTVPALQSLLQDSGANVPVLQSLLQDSGATVPALQSLLQDSGPTVPALQSLLQDGGHTVSNRPSLTQENGLGWLIADSLPQTTNHELPRQLIDPSSRNMPDPDKMKASGRQDSCQAEYSTRPVTDTVSRPVDPPQSMISDSVEGIFANPETMLSTTNKDYLEAMKDRILDKTTLSDEAKHMLVKQSLVNGVKVSDSYQRPLSNKVPYQSNQNHPPEGGHRIGSVESNAVDTYLDIKFKMLEELLTSEIRSLEIRMTHRFQAEVQVAEQRIMGRLDKMLNVLASHTQTRTVGSNINVNTMTGLCCGSQKVRESTFDETKATDLLPETVSPLSPNTDQRYIPKLACTLASSTEISSDVTNISGKISSAEQSHTSIMKPLDSLD